MKGIIVVLALFATLAFSQDCSSYTSCYGCVTNTYSAGEFSCMWCPESQYCTTANETCPIYAGDIQWGAFTCPCPDYQDCVNCASNLGCGWCSSGKNTGSCVNGTLDGPSEDSCSTNDWSYSGLSCPIVKDVFKFLGLGLAAFIAIISAIFIVCCCVIPGVIIYFACCRNSHKYVKVETHHHHGHHDY